MADSAPLTDGQWADVKANWQKHWHSEGLVSRLVATVEQTRRERDAAYAVIRRLLDGWQPVDNGDGTPYWRRSNALSKPHFVPAEIELESMSPAEVDAIRRAQTSGGTSDE